MLVALAGLIPREEHNKLLLTVLPQIRARGTQTQDKVRVVFEGGFCEQPPLDLIRAIARSCYVVDDDLLIGLRWLLEDVSPYGDPLFNLAKPTWKNRPTARSNTICANRKRRCCSNGFRNARRGRHHHRREDVRAWPRRAGCVHARSTKQAFRILSANSRRA